MWYAHVSQERIRRALVFVCFIQIQPGLALVEENMPENKWIQMDVKICHDYIRRVNCKMLHWSKTRGTPQHNPSTHESLSCAKRTYYCGSNQQEEAAPICSTTILYVRVSYCRCCRCIYVGYESVTGTCVNVLYTCQCQEMQQPFGCWHEYRTLRYNSGQCGPSWCKKSCYEESSARPLVSLNTAD